MAYDPELADRVRELVAGQSGVSEQRMFGGLAFLVNGNLAVAASRAGGLLVRVDPDRAEKLVASTNAEVAVMGGRTMRGWLRVAPEDLRTKRQLGAWVERGTARAASLPPKGRHRVTRPSR